MDGLNQHIQWLGAIIVIGFIIRAVISAWPGGGGRLSIDETEGQPDVAEAVKLFKARRWEGLVELYVGRSPADRVHFLQGLARRTKLDAPLPANPRGDLAIVAAGLCLGWAWRYRGAATSITPRGASNALRLLDQAQKFIANAEKADTVTCALMIRITMGRDGNFGELQRQLNIAAGLGERNIMLASAHVMFVAPKWSGSIDEMFAVAREYAAAPKSPAWLVLPVMAHTEALLFRTAMSDDPEDRRRAHDFYFEGEEYRRELESLDDAFWRARNTGEMVGHAENIFAHNTMAYALFRRGLTGRMGAHLDRIGDNLTAVPWGYSGLAASAATAEHLRMSSLGS